MNILESASKIVFILMALGTVIMAGIGVVESKDFIMLTAMAFSFYFSSKGEATKPFAGK